MPIQVQDKGVSQCPPPLHLVSVDFLLRLMLELHLVLHLPWFLLAGSQCVGVRGSSATSSRHDTSRPVPRLTLFPRGCFQVFPGAACFPIHVLFSIFLYIPLWQLFSFFSRSFMSRRVLNRTLRTSNPLCRPRGSLLFMILLTRAAAPPEEKGALSDRRVTPVIWSWHFCEEASLCPASWDWQDTLITTKYRSPRMITHNYTLIVVQGTIKRTNYTALAKRVDAGHDDGEVLVAWRMSLDVRPTPHSLVSLQLRVVSLWKGQILSGNLHINRS